MAEQSSRFPLFLLLAVLMILVPLGIFPEKLGTPLLHPPNQTGQWGLFTGLLLGELVLYGLMLFLLDRTRSIGQLLGGAGLSFLTRLAAGALTGLALSMTFSLAISSSLILALLSFIPAFLSQIVLAPLAVHQILPVSANRGRAEAKREYRKPRDFAHDSDDAGDRAARMAALRVDRPTIKLSSAGSAAPIATMTVADEPTPRPYRPALQAATRPQSETNGFERAVRYIGEHGSVFLAVAVDREGLPLAGFARGGAVIDDWAPFALVYFNAVAPALSRTALGGLEKADFLLREKRIIASQVDFCTLLVIAERQSDDILHIRINQGMEIISRFIQERYPQVAGATVENAYVSGPQ